MEPYVVSQAGIKYMALQLRLWPLSYSTITYVRYQLPNTNQKFIFLTFCNLLSILSVKYKHIQKCNG
jgi:hypothetical protein